MIQHFSEKVMLADVSLTPSYGKEQSNPETPRFETIDAKTESSTVAPMILADNGEHLKSKLSSNVSQDDRDHLFFHRS